MKSTPYPDNPPPYPTGPSYTPGAGAPQDCARQHNMQKIGWTGMEQSILPVDLPEAEGHWTVYTYEQVVFSQPTAHPPIAARLGSGPTATHCGHCSQQVVTKVTYTKGAFTWIMCIIIFVLGGFLGCCLIPCCIGSCQDVNHRCPRCGTSLGTYKRL